jgi:predicted unusual protein kinase regulating ubiquinone biosynthesis (AarF/ABC1/UbiB family)
VLRPVRELARDIETYEWAAAHLEALGGEAGRLRPRLVIANFKRWTRASWTCAAGRQRFELADAMHAFPGYRVPGIDWDRTNGRVMTLDWIDGVKISNLEAIDAAGHDRKEMASRGAGLHAGDQRRLFPCRHAPGQPVRGSRWHDHRDRFRHHGPDRPPGAAMAGRNPHG